MLLNHVHHLTKDHNMVNVGGSFIFLLCVSDLYNAGGIDYDIPPQYNTEVQIPSGSDSDPPQSGGGRTKHCPPGLVKLPSSPGQNSAKLPTCVSREQLVARLNQSTGNDVTHSMAMLFLAVLLTILITSQ